MISMDKMSQSNKKVNPDLLNERKKCTFNVEELASWWNNGPQKLKEKRERGESSKSVL